MVQIIATAPLMITIISRPVSRVMSWIIIYLGLLLPTASSDLPESKPGKLITFFLVLLRMGFTCAPVVTNRAVVSYTALPPLLLWQAKTAVYFCCTGLGVTSTGRYPASCPMKPGLSSPVKKQPRSLIPLEIYLYTLKQLPPTNSLTIEFVGSSSLPIPKKYPKNFRRRFASKYSGSSFLIPNSNGSA